MARKSSAQTFGSYLKKLRTENGMTQEEIAKLLDISIAYVSDVERGSRAPFCDRDCRKLAKEFGVNQDEFLEIAHKSRPNYVLDGRNVSDTKRTLGARLGEAWDDLDDRKANAILAILAE